MAPGQSIIENLLGPITLDYFQDQAQIFFAFSLVIVFTIGWAGALVVLGLGRHLRRPRVVALGSIGLGVMTVATPLGVYVSLLLQRGGIVEATAFDLILLSALGFMGGIMSAVAFLRIWTRNPVNETSSE